MVKKSKDSQSLKGTKKK